MITAAVIAKAQARATKKQAAAASAARLEAIHAEVWQVVKSGKCPTCGRKLRNNLSITGWWQCSQLGAVGFRAEADQPSCDWQGFTQ